jgi:hypothetical protein
MSAFSDEHAFIFVRVPRTASTSFLLELEGSMGPLGDVGPQHATAVELRELLGWKWGRYYSFGYVRNPWDWLVSVYNSGVSIGAGIKEPWQGGLIQPADRPDIHPGQRSNFRFEAWVRQRRTTPMDWLSDGDEVIVDEIRLFENYIETAKTHKSAVAHEPYRNWYSRELTQFVAERCAREIEIGNYEF